MKSTGVVRQIDMFGRIVLPMEIRKTLGIDEKDPMEFFIEGDNLIIRKYTPSCFFCGNTDHNVWFSNKLICRSCAEKISKLI